ncbi:DUF3054 domain-containing protein [Agrococcus jejuensis]|uniref:DUF3054 domain-containing protein n=1 Tax=Agrococcus jejuensis TaxID=399736 RepID=A0A1G8EHI1_9MICO|nr:DUF3054 domain-containing protein [Agrococcus jejuensis]SDH69373.1 Protein of unknown function [Agrococcus jejuensis]
MAPARQVAVAAAIDVVAVVAFAAVGRASHESFDLVGVLATALPFVVALAVGWAATRAWRAPFAPLRTGVPVWLVTVAGGMLLRMLVGEGTAIAFVVVATLTLALLLVGWRGIARLLGRRAAKAVDAQR